MFKMGKDLCIVTVSRWDKIKIHFFTFIFGLWVICKMMAKWIWDPKSFFIQQQRDNPPSCLVDSSLGQHKYVKLKSVKLHYVESGSRDNPLVLLLHGFPDCWLSWRYQIPVLTQHFRVIALDLKGFGDSDKPFRRSTYRMEVILEELKQLITSLGVSNCVIIGHDIGGLLAWCFAHQFPEIASKLVIVSCPHPNIYRTTLHTTSNYHWLNFVQLPYFPEVDALKEDMKIISEYHNHLPPNDMYLEAYKYAFCRKEDWSGPLNYFRNLLYVQVSQNSNTIQVPVVLITGDQDKFVKLDGIVKSTDFCERFHVKLVDSAGHFPHQENPARFNEILLKYLVKKKSIRDTNTERSPSVNRFMNKMFGAVSSTVKYGNSVFDTVHKKTNGVVGNIPNINLLNYSNIYDKTE